MNSTANGYRAMPPKVYTPQNRRLVASHGALAEHYTDPQLKRLTDIFVDVLALRGYVLGNGMERGTVNA